MEIVKKCICSVLGIVLIIFLFLICICVISLTDNCFWCGMQEINGSWINKWWHFSVAYWFLSPVHSASNLIIAITPHLFEKVASKHLHEVYLVQLYFSCFKISYGLWVGNTITESPKLGKYACISSLNHHVKSLDHLHENVTKSQPVCKFSSL